MARRLRHGACNVGAVDGPRPVGYVDDMPLTTAIAKARGTRPQAHLPQVAIVRGSLSGPKIAVVDFKAILTGHAPTSASRHETSSICR